MPSKPKRTHWLSIHAEARAARTFGLRCGRWSRDRISFSMKLSPMPTTDRSTKLKSFAS